MSYRENDFLGLNGAGFHRIAYSDWGPQDGRIAVCVHGLTGNGRDFDWLAPALAAQGYRVIAPDLPGRGRSDFLTNSGDYTYAQYLHDLTALLAHLDITEPRSIDWIGVSLGGLLGIRLAGLPNSPIGRLILNDVGPEVPQAALDFIHKVVAQEYSFGTIEEFEARLRATRGLSWGPMTDEQWHHMAEHNARPLPDGRLTYAYDPAIADVFESQPVGEADLWPSWDAISCPVQVLWGTQSMVLTEGILEKMRGRGPAFDLVQFSNCGHVPSLMAEDQINAVSRWLGPAAA